jgi:hypothetical protein
VAFHESTQIIISRLRQELVDQFFVPFFHRLLLKFLINYLRLSVPFCQMERKGCSPFGVGGRHI